MADPRIEYNKQLAVFYREAVSELQARARQVLVSGKGLTAEAVRSQLVQKDLQEVMASLTAKVDAWVKSEIPKSYKNGMDAANEQMAKAGIRIGGGFSQVNRDALKILMEDVAGVLRQMNAGIAENYKMLARRTQLRKSLDRMVTKETAKGVALGKARREVSSEIASKLIDQFGEGPFRVGAKKFTADQYAELVARTKTAEAHSMGTVVRLAEEGQDLVVVSSHGASDACGFYEGKVFSLSGNDPRYPALTELPNQGPPFHPNCRHYLMPFIEEMASAREIRESTGVPRKALGENFSEIEKRRRAAS